MKHVIQFSISRSGAYYVAEATGFPIVTQAKTFEELEYNIREAVEVYLHDEDTDELGIVKDPLLLGNLEIQSHATQTS